MARVGPPIPERSTAGEPVDRAVQSALAAMPAHRLRLFGQRLSAMLVPALAGAALGAAAVLLARFATRVAPGRNAGRRW